MLVADDFALLALLHGLSHFLGEFVEGDDLMPGGFRLAGGVGLVHRQRELGDSDALGGLAKTGVPTGATDQSDALLLFLLLFKRKVMCFDGNGAWLGGPAQLRGHGLPRQRRVHRSGEEDLAERVDGQQASFALGD